MTVLKESGTMPSNRLRLTNLVIEGSKISIQCLTRIIGIVSRLHDFIGDFNIIFMYRSYHEW